MKKKREYAKRTGIRFDRKHVQGPDAGFLGSDIQVFKFSGSVWPSIEQRELRVELDSDIPVVGYPHNAREMFHATGETIGGGGVPFWADDGVGIGFDAITDPGNWETGDFYYFDPFTSIGAGGFTTDSYGNSWYGGVTASMPLYEGSTIGPRSTLDSARVVTAGGTQGLNDYAIRFMTTGSRIVGGGWDATGGTPFAYSVCLIFRITNATASFDFYAQGCSPPASQAGMALTVVTGNLRMTLSDGVDIVTCSVPLQTDIWYVGIAGFLSQSFSWPTAGMKVGVVPFWGGPAVMSPTTAISTIGAYGINQSRLGDNGVLRASDTLQLSAFYSAMGTWYITDDSLESALLNLQRCVSAPYTTIFDRSNLIDNSIGAFGTAHESQYLNQQYLGLSTGALGRSFGLVFPVTASIPSWTNSHIRNSSFVATTLSSSDYESQSMNYYRSGSEALEITAVPASGTLYYSKNSKYSKITIKKTASLDMVTPKAVHYSTTDPLLVPGRFVPSSGALLNYSSGSVNNGTSGYNRSGGSNDCCTVIFDVPQRGKLVDIAVWVELHHRSGTAFSDGTSQTQSEICTPLGPLGIAIRSPNVQFPLGPNSAPFATRSPSTAGSYAPSHRRMFWSNTFVLWAGLGLEAPDYSTYSTSTSSLAAFPSDDVMIRPLSNVREKYATWERDRDMRVVFTDGASVNNPRMNYSSAASGNYIGAPNAALGFNNAWGFNVSWTGSSGSPPVGWLTGPGGTNAVNEWPTTGSNRGADKIKPIYPMLDPITIRYAPAGPGVNYPTQDIFTQAGIDQPINVEKLTWTRPGLRGTEISGSWHLIFAMDGLDENVDARTVITYLRQARIELTYEEHEGPNPTRRDGNGYSPRRKSERLLYSVSSSAMLGFAVEGNFYQPVTGAMNIYVGDTQNAEVGKTFGIGMNTGALDQNQYALIYRITGSLADISGSSPGWLLNNRFGMPSIPLSSASLVDNSPQTIKWVHPQDLISGRSLIDVTQRLSDAARDAEPDMTRAKYTAELISGTLT